MSDCTALRKTRRVFEVFVREVLDRVIIITLNFVNKGYQEQVRTSHLMAQVGLLEDNIRIARLCSTFLSYVGHEVTIYEYPAKVFQQLLPPDLDLPACSPFSDMPVSPLPIDLLILDYYLPGMNGLEVIQALQANPQTSSLPLILCTAAVSTEVIRTLDLFPQVGFVEKPFHIQTLIKAVSSSLEMAANSRG